MYLSNFLEGKSHRAKVPSDAPETRWAESGDSAQILTGLRPGCCRTASISPVTMDQTIVVASVEHEARNCPQVLKQQQWTPYPCPDSGEKGSSEKSRVLYILRVLSPEHVASSMPEKAHQLTSSRWACKVQIRDVIWRDGPEVHTEGTRETLYVGKQVHLNLNIWVSYSLSLDIVTYFIINPNFMSPEFEKHIRID